MALIPINDLEYQPKTEHSSFVDTRFKRKFKIKLFTLFFVITTFITLLWGYFLALNYFRVISLSHISPIFGLLPISSYEVKDIVEQNTNEKFDEIITIDNNTFLLEGVVQGFEDGDIKIKTKKGKILTFEFTLDSIINTSDNNLQTILFTSDIIKKENIGKHTVIDFIKKNNKNIIIRIEI